jgi:universal stress protein A
LRKILVPTDFSDEARRSAEIVLELIADRAKGELILLHAYHVPVEYSAYGSLPTSWSFFDEVPRTAKTELDKWASHLSSSGWKVTSQIAEGTPASVIVRLAKELDVDLVAMGTHGRSGLKAFMLGSVARRVVQHAPCPVLTVRRHDHG